MSSQPTNAETLRVLENHHDGSVWYRWGPYLAERQWGTVREDYSADGNAWAYLSHDDARSRAYRWGEDGIGGISDRHGDLNIAFAFWNGADPILKERMFGLTNSEGNHGEDVKECYWYMRATPTHSYLKMLYRYPQRAFPYEELVTKNREAGRFAREVELQDTDIFQENRYFDIEIEYAKPSFDRIYCRATITNCGPDEADFHILPTAWFRNSWTWSAETTRPGMRSRGNSLNILHNRYGPRWLCFQETPDEFLFTENETNRERLFKSPNPIPHVKDAFHTYVVHGDRSALHPEAGTKGAAYYRRKLKPGEVFTVKMSFSEANMDFPEDFDELFETRAKECLEFYEEITPNLNADVREINLQAFAGLIWNKQFYHFDVERWLNGDSAQPPPPPSRSRNADWRHFHSGDVLSMPDKWEYPWFASWDLAFHTISFAIADPFFAKRQLLLLLREWYQHPNGQIPAYEWNFSDVNPPVHAWAAWRIYLIERRQCGKGDLDFLKKVFHKLLLNFTWWVNRKDELGNNVFEGGFLGLDNIGVFDRNKPLPDGSYAEQSDGTAWMGMYCLNMLEMALELAREDGCYEDMATKFFEHFLYIAAAINRRAADGTEMWDEDDGFFYDVLRHPNGTTERMKVRSVVGLIPLFAVTTFEPEEIECFPEFRRRMSWFLENRTDLNVGANTMQVIGKSERLLLSLVGPVRLRRIMDRVLDPNEFLSDHGIRSVSRYHKDHPYALNISGQDYVLDYEPGESTNGAFGGNSNWRGPIWFPTNYLLIESLQKFDFYFGDGLKLAMPKGSENVKTLGEIAAELEMRLLSLFQQLPSGDRPIFDHNDFHWDSKGNPLLLFHEYFHGDTGRGLGASHQTGWTGVIAKIIQQLYVTTPDIR